MCHCLFSKLCTLGTEHRHGINGELCMREELVSISHPLNSETVTLRLGRLSKIMHANHLAQ